MTPEVRRVLDVVEDALLKEDESAQDLIAILSALRGPDDEEGSAAKHETTARIRAEAFPRLAATATGSCGGQKFAVGFAVGWELNTDGEPIPTASDDWKYHFRNHVRMAVVALRR